MGVWLLLAPPSVAPLIEEIRQVATVFTSFEDTKIVPFLLLFVVDSKALEAAIALMDGHVDGDTVLWFAYPKKSSKRYRSDINRDEGWLPLGKLGYEPVRQIAIDEDWSALRFKKATRIKKLTRKTSMALSEEAKRRLE